MTKQKTDQEIAEESIEEFNKTEGLVKEEAVLIGVKKARQEEREKRDKLVKEIKNVLNNNDWCISPDRIDEIKQENKK